MPSLKLPSFKIPQVYKVSVQQGNVITQEMIDRLEPGMTKVQVAYIMGEPVVRDPFNVDRWTYLYTLEVPGLFNQNVKMLLDFENGELATIQGDLTPSSATIEGEETPADASAEDTAETKTAS